MIFHLLIIFAAIYFADDFLRLLAPFAAAAATADA